MTSRRGWLIVLGLAIGVIVSNSFARFAYGLILPAMESDLGWNYTQLGWINTANALGYVAGAILTLVLLGRVSASRLFSIGLLVTSVGLLMCGLGDGFWFLTFWRFVAGVSGAPVFIAGGAMAATLFPDNAEKNALAIAGYFGGSGVGMVVAGVALPSLFASCGSSCWPEAWIGLGVASLLIAPISLWAATQVQLPVQHQDKGSELPTTRMMFELVAYGLFAVGYIVYLTFIVAWANANGLPAIVVSQGWILIGVGIVLSPFVWKPILASSSSGVPLALACALTGVATLIPMFLPSVIGFVGSGFLYGLVVFMGPGAITNFSRKNLPKELWAKSVGLFTLIFAVGQTVGPVAAGAIGDSTGSLGAGLISAALILFAAATLAACQRTIIKEQ